MRSRSTNWQGGWAVNRTQAGGGPSGWSVSSTDPDIVTADFNHLGTSYRALAIVGAGKEAILTVASVGAGDARLLGIGAGGSGRFLGGGSGGGGAGGAGGYFASIPNGTQLPGSVTLTLPGESATSPNNSATITGTSSGGAYSPTAGYGGPWGAKQGGPTALTGTTGTGQAACGGGNNAQTTPIIGGPAGTAGAGVTAGTDGGGATASGAAFGGGGGGGYAQTGFPQNGNLGGDGGDGRAAELAGVYEAAAAAIATAAAIAWNSSLGGGGGGGAGSGSGGIGGVPGGGGNGGSASGGNGIYPSSGGGGYNAGAPNGTGVGGPGIAAFIFPL